MPEICGAGFSFMLHDRCPPPNQRLKPTGAATLVFASFKVLSGGLGSLFLPGPISSWSDRKSKSQARAIAQCRLAVIGEMRRARGSLLDRQAGEVTELHQFGLQRLPLRELVQRSHDIPSPANGPGPRRRRRFEARGRGARSSAEDRPAGDGTPPLAHAIASGSTEASRQLPGRGRVPERRRRARPTSARQRGAGAPRRPSTKPSPLSRTPPEPAWARSSRMCETRRSAGKVASTFHTSTAELSRRFRQAGPSMSRVRPREQLQRPLSLECGSDHAGSGIGRRWSWNTRGFSRPGDSRATSERPAASRTAAADHYRRRVGPTFMRKPLSRPERDDGGTSQTSILRHPPRWSAMRVYAVAPIHNRGVAMRHVGPRDAT